MTTDKILTITGNPNHIEIVDLNENDLKADYHKIMASWKSPKSKIKKRYATVGGILQSSFWQKPHYPLICGGITEISTYFHGKRKPSKCLNDVFQDGFILGHPKIDSGFVKVHDLGKIAMKEKRAHAACVVLYGSFR